MIMILRNRVIRHAYDKDSGDPYCGCGLDAEHGIQLKAGSPRGCNDPGHIPNIAAFKALLEDYAVPPETYSEADKDALRLFFSTADDSNAVPEAVGGMVDQSNDAHCDSGKV